MIVLPLPFFHSPFHTFLFPVLLISKPPLNLFYPFFVLLFVSTPSLLSLAILSCPSSHSFISLSPLYILPIFLFSISQPLGLLYPVSTSLITPPSPLTSFLSPPPGFIPLASTSSYSSSTPHLDGYLGAEAFLLESILARVANKFLVIASRCSV